MPVVTSLVFLVVTGKKVNWKAVGVSWCAGNRSFGGVWSRKVLYRTEQGTEPAQAGDIWMRD